MPSSAAVSRQERPGGARTARASLWVPIGDVVAVDTTNVRDRASYRAGSDVPNQEACSLEDLASSLKSQGQLVPCGVEVVSGRYVLRYGFRRYHAAILAALPELWVTVLDGDEKSIYQKQLTENLARKNLNSYEIAAGVKKLTQMGCTLDEVSRTVGLGKQSVYLYSRLMDRLHPSVIDAWRVNPHHASVEVLLKLVTFPHAVQLEGFDLYRSEGRDAFLAWHERRRTAKEVERAAKSSRGRPRTNRVALTSYLSLIREGRYASHSPDFVRGAEAMALACLGEAEFPPPDRATARQSLATCEPKKRG